jgi:glycosyltransferase involved in cell wall biosynthesis
VPAASNKPIKILQVFNQYLEPGGEEVWVDTITGFSGERIKVADLRFQSSEWTRNGAPTRLMQARQVWDNAASRNRLSGMARDQKPDVLLYHNLIPVGSLGLYDEAIRLDIPVVQYIHNFRPFSPSGIMWIRGRVNDAALRGNPWPEVISRAWERSFLKTLLIANYQKKLLSSGALDGVKRWIAVSDFMRDRFVEAGLPPDRVVTLRHCWKPSLSPRTSAGAGYYLFLGRLVPEKGIYTLLDAWRLLEKRLGSACPCLIIAGSGPHEAAVQAASHRMRSVVCVGFVRGPLKHDLLTGCRALIAPSIWWEPLGLIIHEAYDAGRPVLAAASGGLTETVLPDVTGYVHAPGNAEALADDVERMESLKPEQRISMGREGRNWLLKHASQEEWMERFTDILASAAGK